MTVHKHPLICVFMLLCSLALLLRVPAWEPACAHMLERLHPHKCRAGEDLVICCSRARDFKLDLQLSQGQMRGEEEADLVSKSR